MKTPFQPGDIRLTEVSDQHGKWARDGKHSNAGYSGFFKAFIFDGTRWRNMRLHHIVTQEESTYLAQYEKQRVRNGLVAAIERVAGQIVTWVRSSYELAAQPAASNETG